MWCHKLLYLKCVSKVLGKMCDSRISYIASVTIRASVNNFISRLSYKDVIQCCHVWWMWIIITSRNEHQRELNQLRKLFAEALIVLFCLFYLWYCIACPLDDWHRGNIRCARIKHLFKDFWDTIYYWLNISSRPIVIKTIREGETSTAIIRRHNTCLVHFLEISNINLTKVYLKSAWKAGAVGANDYYLVTLESKHQVALLNFSEIFDFQRLLIAKSPMVCSPR